LGLGWSNYLKNPWNTFDLLLLVTGLVDMFLTLFMGRFCVAWCWGSRAAL
jgi:hypothetical protein